MMQQDVAPKSIISNENRTGDHIMMFWEKLSYLSKAPTLHCVDLLRQDNKKLPTPGLNFFGDFVDCFVFPRG